MLDVISHCHHQLMGCHLHQWHVEKAYLYRCICASLNSVQPCCLCYSLLKFHMQLTRPGCIGYDGGVTGGIIEMEPFAQEFFPDTVGIPDTQFYCKYNDRTLQTFASLMHFTGALAAFPAGYYTATYGRTRYVRCRNIAPYLCVQSPCTSLHQSQSMSHPGVDAAPCCVAKYTDTS